MRRFRDLFSRLRWKLALTYTLVTVAALLVAEVGLIAISQGLEPVLLAPSPARFAVEYIAPQVQAFLLKAPPDTDGLNQWLLRSAIQGFQIETADGQATWLNLITPFQGDLQMMVFDCQGALLATLPPETIADQRSYKEALDVPGVESLWPIALSGESDPDQLYKYSDGNILTTAAPIMGDGMCLGILVITGTSQDPQRADVPTLFSIIGASALGFAIIAGLIGLIFGFVASRGLSRRISELSRASEAWSKGDFKVFVHDQSADELGQLTQRLNRMAEQLQHLLHSRQQLAMLEERNRLARDLHDSVKQQAFGLAAQLRTMRALLRKDLDAMESHLAEAEKLTAQIRNELTAMIRELRPEDLKQEDFAEQLRVYVKDWIQQNSIEANVNTTGKIELPQAIRRTLTMVLQEALSNVARHSRASIVDIQLSREGEYIQLEIDDNGLGFDVESGIGHGLGLLSMRERMEAFGGQLEVVSDLGQGTKITVSCEILESGSIITEGID